MKKQIYLLLILLLTSFYTSAQIKKQETRILFLLDASGSMLGQWEDNYKIDVAKEILTNLVDSLSGVSDITMALRVYGHQSHRAKQDCKDTKLEVPFSKNNSEEIINKLSEIKPKGTTPIAYSLTQAAGDFPDNSTKNVIILITDGIEECGGDPCAVSMALQRRGVILKPFIIGLGINTSFRSKFDCVGRFFNAQSEKDFEHILNIVISQALNRTSAQVNLLDIHNNPTETDVNMTFYDADNGIIRYNLYHTMNALGLPDTIIIDPFTTYNIEVHTTPPVYKNNVTLDHGKHNIIPIKAPQGYLNLTINGITNYDKLSCIVRKPGSCDVVNVQDFNTSHKYIVGKYDLEILTLPRIEMNNVEIKQSETTKIQIPQPGKVSISTSQSMIGSIYIVKENKMVWVANTNPFVRREIMVLQPGEYTVVYRPKAAYRSYQTNQREFNISSGGITNINL